MARFSISFATNVMYEADKDPVYRVRVSTGLQEPANFSAIDSNLLVISRNKNSDSDYVDTFYGIIKPSDFAAMSKNKPKPGVNFYRAAEWNLIFYNLKTMNEAITLMKKQIDILAEDMTVFFREQNNRYETHISTSF